jgi:hypothetical protein
MVTNPSNPPKANSSASEHDVSHAKKHWLFFTTNGLVFLLVTVALALNPHSHVGTGTYVIILFILCSLPSVFIANYRGKASLMLMFLAYYFGTFGLLDLSNLISFKPLPPRPTGAFFTLGEIVILVGAVSFMAGYALTAGLSSDKNTRFLKRDWSPNAVILAGLIVWVIGFYSNAYIQFGVGDQFTLKKYSLGVFGGFIALSRILGPLGFLMLVYSFLTTKKKSSMYVMLCMMAADFVLGFVGDSKETAIRDPLLFLFSFIILRERVPVVLTVIFIVMAGLSFNYFAAYRHELGSRHESRVSAVSNIDYKLEKIFGQNKTLGESFADGLEYFSSRITLKQNVELLVSRVGVDREYKGGYTLIPLLYAFIPRFIAPDKQDATQVGRLFNREFFSGGSRDTYISVSNLGELYWNFGFSGVVVGMMCIGMLMAYIASLAVGSNNNLPRYLLLLLTIYLLVLRSESALAMTYTYWARAVVLLLLIHMLMPKSRAVAPAKTVEPTDSRMLRTRPGNSFVKPGVK